MASTYKQFLASPSSSLLAAGASLHYVTTTTTVRGATDIIKHFTTLRNQVGKNSEETLEVIDGGNVVAFQVKTSLTFITSGGPYLPGLDDNFLADLQVNLPIVRHHPPSLCPSRQLPLSRLVFPATPVTPSILPIGATGPYLPREFC